MSLKKKSSLKKATKEPPAVKEAPLNELVVVPAKAPSRKNSNASSNGSRRSSLNPQSRSRNNSDIDIFSGTYAFERYDENLEEYLDSLGLPGKDLGPIVRATKVKILLKKPKWPDVKWSLTTYEIVDGMESASTVTYEIDKPYTSLKNGVEEVTTVSKPLENILVYTSKVPSNGWNIEDSTFFTHEGIIATIRNLNSGVTTIKYYKRLSE